jgi:hypothetical protein
MSSEDLPLTAAQIARVEPFVSGAALPRPPRDWLKAKGIALDSRAAAQMFAYELSTGRWPRESDEESRAPACARAREDGTGPSSERGAKS